MTHSVRCHAVIIGKQAYRNVIVRFESSAKFASSTPLPATEFSLINFTGELHSTIDFNGIAVAQSSEDSAQIPSEIPAQSLSQFIEEITGKTSPVTNLNNLKITFVPLCNVRKNS